MDTIDWEDIKDEREWMEEYQKEIAELMKMGKKKISFKEGE